MEITIWTIIIFAILLVHLFFAFTSSVEVVQYPLFTTQQRIVWLLILWLMPIIGQIAVNKRIGLKGGTLEGDGSSHIAGGDD